MVTAPVLAMPDFTQPFIVETDASDKGLGAVLMQGRRPIAFMSKSIGVKAQGFSTYEKEFLALLSAVQKWRHYLIGGQFIIRTDQISLKHLLEQRVNHMLQHKGLCKLMGLDYKIEYKKGIENKVADALSRQQRQECSPEAETLAVSELIPSWVEEVRESYNQDPWVEELKAKLNLEGNNCKFTHSLGIWRYKGRICIGNAAGWRERLVHEIHDTSVGGHSGILATYKRIKASFYWPHMKESVHDYVKSCDTCQQTKHENFKLPGLLQPLPIPNEAWSSVSMDFISGLPKSNGKDVILVMVDRLTKYAHFVSLKHPFKASDVAQLFMETVYKLHRLPKDIVSDRDPVFTSRFWKELMDKLGVKLNMSTAYHPQTDGQTERVNQCIEGYLRCMLFNQPKDWNQWLPLAEIWYNTNFHTSLKTTPFKALYGYDPPQLPLGSFPKATVEAVDITLKERHQWILALRDQLKRAQDRMKRLADEKRSDRQFKIGDWVYLKLQPYRQLSVQNRVNQKLSPKFYGPFEVISKMGEVAYELNLPNGTLIHPVFHVSQLKARVSNTAAITPNLPLQFPPSTEGEIPEGILGRRTLKRENEPVYQILIKWKNLDEENSSWEDYEAIRTRFPEFILRDKENFERERVSGNTHLRLGAVEGVDEVRFSEEKKREQKLSGQNEGVKYKGLKTGARGSGKELNESGQLTFQGLTVGLGHKNVKETNGVKKGTAEKEAVRTSA